MYGGVGGAQGRHALRVAGGLARDLPAADRPDLLLVSRPISPDLAPQLHARFPHCEVVGVDGTLNAARRHMLPSFVRFVPEMFGSRSWTTLRGGALARSGVTLLKIDCEGCEFRSVVPWAEHVCTEQIILEVHQSPGCRLGVLRPPQRVARVHSLLSALDALGYSVYYYEPNPVYPALCGEYSLVRREPCPQGSQRQAEASGG